MTRGLGLAVSLFACSATIDDQFHVRTSDGVVLPVLVRGELETSQTLVLYETGGPYGGGIEERIVDYQSFSKTLEPHLAIAYYDRRGYGNANGRYRPGDLSLEALLSDVDDVLAVLRERYDPRRVVLMGHSFGGFLTASYLVSRPDAEVDAWVSSAGALLTGGDAAYVPYRLAFACRLSADRLAMGAPDPLWAEIDAWCKTDPDVDPDDWEQPERRTLSGYLDAIYDRVGDPPISAGRLISAIFASSYNVTDVLFTANEISDRISPEVRDHEPLVPSLSELAMPSLLVSGELDDVVPAEIATDTAAGMPDARVVEIPGGGHYPTWPDPQPFADAVLDFLH